MRSDYRGTIMPREWIQVYSLTGTVPRSENLQLEDAPEEEAKPLCLFSFG